MRIFFLYKTNWILNIHFKSQTGGFHFSCIYISFVAWSVVFFCIQWNRQQKTTYFHSLFRSLTYSPSKKSIVYYNNLSSFISYFVVNFKSWTELVFKITQKKGFASYTWWNENKKCVGNHNLHLSSFFAILKQNKTKNNNNT